jgi:hypothetical protein
MPCLFAFHDGFISHFDLNSCKLVFYKYVSARIEVTQEKDSFIDEFIKIKGRKQIED